MLTQFSLVLCCACFYVPAGQDDWRGLAAKAQQAEKSGNLQDARKLLDTAIKLEPKRAELFSMRGGIQFKLGKIQESLADFDQQIRLKPSDAPAHWRRGLTLYYADKFSEGVAQFVTSDKAEPEDVENAVWHLLCNAKVKGVEQARKEMLKVSQDSRVPMMEVYALFAGKSSVEKVLSTANAAGVQDKTSSRFYAYLYSGLYEEMMGQPMKSQDYFRKALEHPIDHYMMDVARVHVQLRKK